MNVYAVYQEDQANGALHLWNTYNDKEFAINQAKMIKGIVVELTPVSDFREPVTCITLDNN